MIAKVRGMLTLLAVCVVHISTADTLSTFERVLDRIDNLEANLHHGGKGKRGHQEGNVFGGLLNGALNFAGGALNGAGQIAGGLAQGAGGLAEGALQGTGEIVGDVADVIFGHRRNGGSGNNRRGTTTRTTTTQNTYHTGNGGSRNDQGQSTGDQADRSRSGNNRRGTTTTTTYGGSGNNQRRTSTTATHTTTTHYDGEVASPQVFEIESGSGDHVTLTTPPYWTITRKDSSSASQSSAVQQNSREQNGRYSSRGGNFNSRRVQENTLNDGGSRFRAGDLFRGAGNLVRGFGNSLFRGHGHDNSHLRYLETAIKELKELQKGMDMGEDSAIKKLKQLRD